MPNSDDDAAFLRQLESWIVGFHGGVKPLTEETVTKRVRSYVRQEETYREVVGFILSLLPDRPRRGLDVGSSAGGLSVALAQTGVDMDGIEPSQPGVTVSMMRARRLHVANARFHEGVGEALPFADASFDLAVSIAVLEHVQDIDKVLIEVQRVLKPGGWFYAEVPNYLCPFEPHYKVLYLPMMPKPLARAYVRVRGFHPAFVNHLNYTNRFNVLRRFAAAGFTEVTDVYARFLAGKAQGAPWAAKTGRLARMPWAAPVIPVLFGPGPIAWFVNRIVAILARKPL